MGENNIQDLTITKAWLPDYRWNAQGAAILDEEFFDFDQQAERLTSHGQEYLQVTKGRFHGRFVSCVLSPQVALHIEYANQALSQTIKAANDDYAIGVVLSPEAPFRANGCKIDGDSIFIVPPGVDFHLYSPPDAAILACVVDRHHFDSKLQTAPQTLSLLSSAHGQIAHLKGPNVASRLRQDAFSALNGMRSAQYDAVFNTYMASALVDSLIATLTLDWVAVQGSQDPHLSKSFVRFLKMRSRLLLADGYGTPIPQLVEDITSSKRSIQLAFSTEVSLGVTGYLRHHRLHAVRRALQQNADQDSTIGDLAAQHGFWNWSHFSQLYSQLFGELPSETRSAAQSRS